MRNHSLRDLDIAGVKWELSETANINKTPIQKTNNDSVKPAVSTSVSTNNTAIIPPSAPVSRVNAVTVADTARDLGELTSAIMEFGHPLCQFAKNIVPPVFSKSDIGLLIITDIPSSDDDDCGRLLTGNAGDLMDKMLNAIGINRDDVSIIPLVFCRTPGGRGPSTEELDLARPFVTRAISMLNPRAILTLGALSATEIVGAKLPKDHGQEFKYADNIPVIPIYHPNYLILKPDAKRTVWESLQNLQNLLKTA